MVDLYVINAPAIIWFQWQIHFMQTLSLKAIDLLTLPLMTPLWLIAV